jgi:hypothetical protein
VTSATPALPVNRPTAAAINAALASWRTGMISMEESSRESKTLSIFARDTEHLLHALRFQLADNHIGAVRPLA